MTDISDRASAWNALHSPVTDAATLAAIAGAHPEFAGTIARHPHAYPALREWAAGQAPASAAIAPALPQAASTRRNLGWWIAVGAAMIVMPTLADLISTSVGYGSDQWMLLGSALLILPQVLLVVACLVTAPTPGGRVGATVFSVLALAVVAATQWPSFGYVLYQFPVWAAVALLSFLAWALARPLRGAGYAAVAVLVVLQLLLYFFWPEISEPLYGVGGSILVILAYSVVAALILVIVVACAIAWSRVSERRSAASIPGAVSLPSAARAPGYGGAGTTNTMAVLSLVFAFVFSILGIVFGHVALSQIRRTGENGRGLAIAGLVIGYVSVAAGVTVAVVYVAMIIQSASDSSFYSGY